MERNYFMVRAMHSNEKELELFQQKGVVAIGWSEVDFTKYATVDADLKREVIENYYSDTEPSPQVMGKKFNQIQRFLNIKKGDFILVPYWNKILLAEATGEQIYSEEAYYHGNATQEGIDLANQHKVVYQKNEVGGFKIIPRDSLSGALQRRLRVRGAIVSDLWEFKDDIEEMFGKDNYSFLNGFLEEEQNKIKKAKAELLSNIQNGKTGLKEGGIGLERLIKELLECEGYEKVQICAKNHFKDYGDADVEASKTDQFLETQNMLFQVKHHRGTTGRHGLDQLLVLMKEDQYKDYKLGLITSGKLEDSLMQEAQVHEILHMDGEALVEWIFDNIEKLSSNTKMTLRISTAPVVL